jgi:hypothetical protein
MPVSRLLFSPVTTETTVYLLYLDESGNPSDPADRNFVLAGLAVSEKSVHYLADSLDRIQNRFFPGSPPIEFHANAMRSGRGFWRGVEKEKRETVLLEIGYAIRNTIEGNVVAFGAAVEKDYEWHGEAALRLVLEQVCNRFNIFLKVRQNEHDDPHRGLIVFAESHYQQRAKVWVNDFKRLGTQWGILSRVCDIPYFASTAESRLLQAADYVAYATFQLYEHRNPTLISPIWKKFDQKDGILHGLVHWARGKKDSCGCPACHCRRDSGAYGTWLTSTTST